ncbi:MAG: cytochrome c [Methylacidiphilales bacterium]|nr:cytochrome c [Candidatus Methylacidiphilales bacterium]
MNTTITRKLIFLFSVLYLNITLAEVPTVLLSPKEKLSNIDYRKSYFTILGNSFGLINTMAIEKKIVFDMKQIREATDNMYYITKVEVIKRGFGLNSIIPKQTKAKAEIWKDWDTFTKLHSEMIDKIDTLKRAVDKDKDDFIIADIAKDVGNSCRNCHDKFKSKK